MIHLLMQSDYEKILPLVRSKNELSVFSVLYGKMPGKVYVDNADHPSSALIRTSECNMLAGDTGNRDFNASLASVLDFWDTVTPDTDTWIQLVPSIHPNRSIRQYKRRHYLLTEADRKFPESRLDADYTLQPIDPAFLRSEMPQNAYKILNWTDDWGSDENFTEHGVGFMIRHGDTVAGWSVADCYINDSIAIGLYIDEAYRRRGFGLCVASASVEACFEKGYREINWLCVDANRGSRATAEKLGFRLQEKYDSFSSYPPYENITDQTEEEWNEWAEYLENASRTEPRLLIECLHAYIKANNPPKVMILMENAYQNHVKLDYKRFDIYIAALQDHNLCSNFLTNSVWKDFIAAKQIN